jgi:hypothetical protein
MASLLNNASLLLNPAGSIIAYEEDKIFSVLPSNGTGDFTFSGGDGGTRVNQQGYIEQTPANLVTYSEDFSNWAGNLFNNWISLSVTTDFALAPNGTLTADRLGDGYARFNTSATAIPGQTYTFSIYLKNINLNADFYAYVAWGLNGTLVTYNTIGDQIQISQLSTTEWKRFTFTTTAPSSGINQMQFGPAPFTGYGTNTAGTQFLAWGGMVNIGSTAKPYQPTTDRLNYPRITYQNGRGALLSEPQRTNVLTNSQNFNLTPHTLQNATITTGSGISPDGTNNANKLISSGGSNTFYRWYDDLGALGGTYTYSIFAKADSGSMQYVCIGVNTNASNGPNNVVEYNIANGTISRNPYGVTAYIEPYKDGWYRLVHTYNLGTAGSFVHPCIAISNGTATLSTFQNLWDSTAGQYVYLWGSQYEAGAFPTSYIPTTSATVTRPADSTNNTNATSVIGQTEGVIYSDLYFEPNGVERNYIYLNDSTGYTAGFCYLVGSTTNRLILDLYNNPYTQQFSAQSAVLTSGRYKAAIAYKQNDFAFYLNGVQIATDNNGTIPTLDRVYIGQGSDLGFATGAPVFTTSLFNTRLTNTQLAELTTVRSGSGGNISYYGPYTIHTFTGSATFTPSFNGQVEVLVVAGGGGGGTYAAGAGGGAGGLLYASSYGVSAGTGITVTVGAGGTGGNWGSVVNATQGSNSVFGPLTAIGGGRGGTGWVQQVGGNGGSGGGGGGYDGSGGTFTIAGGTGITGQGNNGGLGRGISGNRGAGGGGGGAGQVGGDSTTNSGGNGGNGLPYSLSGFSTYYAGGGGGGDYGSSNGGQGGLGGGGNVSGGNSSGIPGFPGVPFSGGGGGGSRSATSDSWNGGNGGAGIVIVRYLT